MRTIPRTICWLSERWAKLQWNPKTFRRLRRNALKKQLRLLNHRQRNLKRICPAPFVSIHIFPTKPILTSEFVVASNQLSCCYDCLTSSSHIMKEHLPGIAKYACGSCRETFEQLSDHKAHETKHTREKIPYTCYICSYASMRPRDFIKWVDVWLYSQESWSSNIKIRLF